MKQWANFNLPLVILGAGGHAKVVLALAEACGRTVVGICDPQLSALHTESWRKIPVLGGDEALDELELEAYGLVNGVGQLPRQNARQGLYERCQKKGFVFPVLVHPFSWVAEDVLLEDGVQVMAGAVLQPGCRVGANSIINSRASVDHDCHIASHVHIAPGATLCGGVSVSEGAYIGAGAIVIQGVSVGRGAILGAGATCVTNIDSGEVYVGEAKRK